MALPWIRPIVSKFKVKGTVVTPPGWGQKRKLSMAATRFLRRHVQKNPEVSACTVRHVLNACSFHARTPRCTPLLTQKHRKSSQNHINRPQKFCDSVLWSDETILGTFWPYGSAICLEEEEWSKFWKEHSVYS